MKAHRIALFLPLVLALIIGLPARAADDVIAVPVILSLTGPFGFYGQTEQSALRVLESSVNEKGGIGGRKVRFDIGDDASNPQVAVQLVSALIARKAPVILGPGFTATCQAVAPLVEKSGPLTYCLSPAVFPQRGGYMLMSVPSFDDVEPVLFRYLVSRKLLKIGMITSTDASGADFEKRVDGTLSVPEFKNIRILAREHFGITDISVSAQMARIKATDPDVLLTFTSGTPFGTLLRGIHDAGLSVPIYGSGGNYSYAQMQQYESFLPKELFLNAARGITDDPTATGDVKRAQSVYASALARGRSSRRIPDIICLGSNEHRSRDDTASRTGRRRATALERAARSQRLQWHRGSVRFYDPRPAGAWRKRCGACPLRCRS